VGCFHNYPRQRLSNCTNTCDYRRPRRWWRPERQLYHLRNWYDFPPESTPPSPTNRLNVVTSTFNEDRHIFCVFAWVFKIRNKNTENTRGVRYNLQSMSNTVQRLQYDNLSENSFKLVVYKFIQTCVKLIHSASASRKALELIANSSYLSHGSNKPTNALTLCPF
jgi:hypothetical protein